MNCECQCPSDPEGSVEAVEAEILARYRHRFRVSRREFLEDLRGVEEWGADRVTGQIHYSSRIGA